MAALNVHLGQSYEPHQGWPSIIPIPADMTWPCDDTHGKAGDDCSMVRLRHLKGPVEKVGIA